MPKTVESETISVIAPESSTIYQSSLSLAPTELMIRQQFLETHESAFSGKHCFHVSTNDRYPFSMNRSDSSGSSLSTRSIACVSWSNALASRVSIQLLSEVSPYASSCLFASPLVSHVSSPFASYGSSPLALHVVSPLASHISLSLASRSAVACAQNIGIAASRKTSGLRRR